MNGALDGLELGLPIRRTHGYNDQLMPIGGDLEGRFGVDVQEVENRAVNHELQTVSVLCEFLTIGVPYPQCIPVGSPRDGPGTKDDPQGVEA